MKEQITNSKGIKYLKSYGNILVLLIIVILFFVSFMVLGFKEKVDDEFIITSIITFACICMTYFTIRPDGIKRGTETKLFQVARLKRIARINEIDNIAQKDGKTGFDLFSEHIDWCNSENIKGIIKNRLSSVGLGYSDYEKIRDFNNEEGELIGFNHDLIENDKKYTKKQRKAIYSIFEKGVYCKSLIANNFTTNSENALTYEAKNTETIARIRQDLTKTLTFLLNTLVSAYILFQTGAVTLNSVMQFLIYLLIITWSYISADRDGQNLVVVHRVKYFNSHINIFNIFFAKQGIDIKVIDEQVNKQITAMFQEFQEEKKEGG